MFPPSRGRRRWCPNRGIPLAQGKEDRRAGGADIAVDGCHQMVVLRMLLGDPKWVFAHVTHDGREHIKEASEPIGPIVGNQIAAIFAFDGGVHAYFGSKANDLTDPKRFGYYFYGSEGVIYMPNGVETQPYILRSPAWMPDERRRWEKIETARDAGRGVKAEGRGWRMPEWWATCWKPSSTAAIRCAMPVTGGGARR